MRKAVSQCFPALLEGGTDHVKQKSLIRNGHGRLIMAGEPDHGTADIWLWDKAFRRNGSYDFRLCIILDSQGQGTVIFRARTNLHALCHFLLYHDSNAF